MTTIEKTKKTVDPVCGMSVNPEDSPIKTAYEGHSYYFCAEHCRKAFEANPSKYLKSGGKKKKGIWGRYLDRLNKATGGKPPSCCH